MYACTECGMKFINESKRKRHMKTHAGHSSCHVCNEIFQTKHLLARHEVEHGITYPCSLCSETFHSRLLFQQHELVHDGVTTSGSNNPNAAVTTSRSKNPHFCILCDKGFGNKTIFTDHLLWHKGDKSRCHLCRKYFSKEKYAMHLNTHKNILHCDRCDATFYNAKLWKIHRATHLNKHHIHDHYTNMHTKTTVTDSPYKCPKCDKTFTQRKNMSSHCNKVHICSAIIQMPKM